MIAQVYGRKATIGFVFLAVLGATSWPLLLARYAIAFAYHGKHLEARAVVLVLPLVATVTGAVAFIDLQRNRVSASSLTKQGALGGAVIGGTLMAICELWRLGETLDAAARGRLLARAIVGGTLWAAPVAIPTGALLGLTTFLVSWAIGIQGAPHGPKGLRIALVSAVIVGELSCVLLATA